MDKTNSGNLDRLLELVSEKLSPADILSAKLLAQISGKIAEKRLELNMNQTEFAQYMGVTQGMISKWEGSDYNFTIKTLAKIAEKLDLNLDVTFEDNPNKNQITAYQSKDYKVAQ
jgi:transcriptional regulator with XRE-family HTH domain